MELAAVAYRAGLRAARDGDARPRRRRCRPTRCAGCSTTSAASAGRGSRSRPGDTVFDFARTRQMAHDPLPVLLPLYERYGPIFTLRLLHSQVVFMLGPEANSYVTVTHPQNFHWREGSFGDLIPLLGDGLLTIDGAYHDRARRIMMPAFHREQIEAVDRDDDRGDRARRWRTGARATWSTSTVDAQPGDADRDAGAARARPRRRRARTAPPPSTSSGRWLLRDRLPPAAAARARAPPGAS